MAGTPAQRADGSVRATSPAAAELARLDAATGGLNPVSGLRKTLAAGEAAAEKRRKRRDRILTAIVVLICVASAVVSVVASGNRAEEIAPEVAARVGAQQVTEARQSRINTGRQKLAEANTQLIARRLPTVSSPGPEVPFERLGDELFYAALFGRLLAILPDDVAAGVRADVRAGRTPAVLPSSAAANAIEAGDGVVDVIPVPTGPTVIQQPGGTVNSREPRTPDVRPAPAPRNPGTAPAPAPRNPAPAPVPAPARRPGLLPAPCLLGVVLCPG